jgi:hypothetical protein
MRYPLVHRRALGAPPLNCPPGQFSDGTQCRSSVGTMPGGAGVPNVPGNQPPAGPTPAPSPSGPTGASPSPAPSPSTTPQNLTACINGPDLYDVYGPGMSLVAKAVLNPNASYPGAQISFPKGPPCPVPQATGAGGLCDLPMQYLAKGQSKPVLGCWDSKTGWTLYDHATGAVIGQNISGACISLLGSFTAAQPGSSLCSGASAPAPSPSGTPPATAPAPAPGSIPTQPLPGQAPVSGAASGPIPTQPIQPPQTPGGSPWPAYGSPIGVPAPSYGAISSESMQAPGYGGGIQAKPMPTPALMPPPQRMACENALKPKPLDQWLEECPGVKKARGY